MKTKKLLFLLSFLIAGLCSNIVAQIQFQDSGCYTFSMVTLNQSDMVDGRNTYTGAETSGPPINFKIIWTGSQWEIQAGESGSLQAIYYNTAPSTPNPPDLTLGTWVVADETDEGECSITTLTGDVQNFVDLSAPIFENSTPSVSLITDTGFTLSTDIDRAGTIYYVVVPDGEDAPTVADVRNGTAVVGSDAHAAGNQEVSTGAFAYDFLVTGLIGGTDYDVYVVAEDDETTPNVQASVTKVDVTTTGISFTGAIDEYWSNAGNWSNNTVPTATDDVFISNNQYPEVQSGVSVAINNLVIGKDANLSINDGSSITINGNLDLRTYAGIFVHSKMSSAGTINSGSVVLKGTYTEATPNSFKYSTETYHNNDDGWTLVSSPTVGEVINEVNAGPFATGFAKSNKLQKNANHYGIAKYDNSVATNRWDYYTLTEVEDTSNNLIMTSGKGYSVFPDSDAEFFQKNGNVRFKGSIPTADINIAIADNSTGSGTGVGNAFNLIGNPYPASIPANSNADGTNNILTVNAGVLAEQTLWFWKKEAPVDGVTKGSYITVNQATASRFIAPTQGFFVKSNTAGGDFNFTKTMESHQQVGEYNRNTNTRPEISLTITQNSSSKSTSVYYINGTTTGFDNGYDSTVFGGDSSTLQLFTGLVDNTSQKQLAIQSLPDSNYEAMIIPVGIKAVVGKEVTLSTDAVNLPTDVQVYLEDRENGVFTNLSEGNHKFVLDTETTSTGRFYLHLSSRALSIDTVNTVESIGIFKSNKNELTVSGLDKKATLQLFNVLGKQVLSKVLDSKSTNIVALPSLAKGVYVVQLVSTNGKLSKKIIID